MIKKTIITVVVALFAGGFLSTPAQASHCPKDVKLINAAISKMDDKKMSLAKKHGEAIKILHVAMESLGIKH